MSHFTVLVIGDDPEKQLAGFHEFECTGIDDEHVQDVDITAEVLQKVRQYANEGAGAHNAILRALQYYGHEPERLLRDEYDADLKGPHKYGWAVVRRDPFTDLLIDLIKVVKRTNPRARWDWYRLGGRWRGFFKLKTNGAVGTLGTPGIFATYPNHDADQALKRDIDFDGMRDAAGEEAGQRHDRFVHLVGLSDTTRPWSEFVHEERLGTMDERRDAYWAQPGTQALKDARTRSDLPEEDRDLLVWLDYDEYNVPREIYVDRARQDAVSTFAVVKDGQWYERGSMGWWGCVTDEKDQIAWNREVAALLDSVPGDTLLSLYDCHC